ncbi:MAG: carboxypeptidase-like regulatory domain-containing protein, partial [Christiangramia sp.]|nr:carboxypeptidase-like regulatory domain-containing protein [Christiangramia sp.]
MRYPLIILFLLSGISLTAQNLIPGRVINRENRKPLAYAQIQTSDGRQILTNIDGSFELDLTKDTLKISVSYVGFKPLTTQVHRSTRYLQIGLSPSFEQLNTVLISS